METCSACGEEIEGKSHRILADVFCDVCYDEIRKEEEEFEKENED